MKIKGLGIFSNPLEGKPLMDKINIFPVQKISLTPEMVDMHGWDTIKAMINSASRCSRKYGTQFIVLAVPRDRIDIERAKRHYTRIHNWLKKAEEKQGLKVLAIDLGIELRIVAEYDTVSEYLPYWNVARDIFKRRKLIGPGFTLISNREFNELREFLHACEFKPDILGIHLYGASYENNFGHKRDMLERVRQLTGLPIALTETGQHSKKEYAWWDIFKTRPRGGEKYQSDEIMKWFRYLLIIDQVIWVLLYTFANDARYLHDREGHFGVLHEKEKGFSPKPVFHKLAQLIGGGK